VTPAGAFTRRRRCRLNTLEAKQGSDKPGET
jgi:hypothetical protein